MALTERYELVRVIGAGGMAQVFEGIAHGAAGFERRVAIKRLVPEHADDETFQRMFVDEARIASRLHHAHIVQVLDYGSVEGSQFLVLEFVDGPDASRAARIGAKTEQPIDPSVALHLVVEIAHALDYAHNLRDEAGEPLQIVHRDISPGNVLLSWEGDVKLSDFGIATATLREEHTRTGLIKGKASYMPPEQAMGRSLDGSADVYALGATLSALVFHSPRAEGRAEKRVEASPQIADLVQRCMDADAARRPSAAELADEAERLRLALGAGSGRSELRRWLEGIRAHTDTGARKASPFDQMLGLCLVPAAEEGGHFTVSRAGPTQADLPPGARAGEGASTTLRTRRGKVLVLVAALLFALSAVIYAGWTLLGPAAQAPAAMVRGGPDLGLVAATPDASPPSSVRLDLSAPDVIGAEPDAAPRRASPSRPRSPRPKRRRATVKQAPQSKGSGWVRIGGSALLRAKIELDGKSAGRAPAALQLSLGKHLIVIRSPDDGRILLEKTVEIREGHRRSTPLRLIAR